MYIYTHMNTYMYYHLHIYAHIRILFRELNRI